MASGLELHVNISPGTEIAQRFDKAGDSVRDAVLGVFDAAGKEIVSAAQSRAPKHARFYYRVKDGSRDSGSGRIRLIVNTTRRTRWTQQFEEGTVGAGPEAVRGSKKLFVRSHERRHAGGFKVSTAKLFGRSVKLATSDMVRIGSYSRVQHMPTRPFMGPAFRPVAEGISARIEKAVTAAMGLARSA